MKNSNSHTQSRIGVSDKDPIIKIMSCCVDTSTLGEIEGFGCLRLHV